MAWKTRSVTTMLPQGITAPPKALPMVMMSGATSQLSTPQSLPVRPMPVCTSSAMKTTSHSVQISRTRGR